MSNINLMEISYLFYKRNEKSNFEFCDDDLIRQSICDDLEEIVKDLGFEWDGEEGVGDLVSELKDDMFHTLKSGFHLLNNQQ